MKQEQPQCTIQLHMNGAWQDAAVVTLRTSASNGWRAKSRSDYTAGWAVAHFGARGAQALCSPWPVGLETLESSHWPVFLIDMLPQGRGRQELLRNLGKPPTAGDNGGWPLLLAGAGNPIGNLRVKEAATWLATRPGDRGGFTDDEIATLGVNFFEHLKPLGPSMAGSAGI